MHNLNFIFYKILALPQICFKDCFLIKATFSNWPKWKRSPNNYRVYRKKWLPSLTNLLLLDHFPSNFRNFYCHSVLLPHTKQLTFNLFCQIFKKLLGKMGSRGSFLSLHPVIDFMKDCFFTKNLNLKWALSWM